jgi:hypothetical protein
MDKGSDGALSREAPSWRWLWHSFLITIFSSWCGPMALSNLDFSPGIRFMEHVRAKFGTSITPPPNAAGFLLVVSFSRSLVRLNEDSASLMLQSCLGGLAKDFCVKWLSGWCFSFEVRSKDVGFLIYGSRSFSCKPFSVHFSLWGNGGPNWKKEFSAWLEEQYREWTPVRNKKSYTAVVKSGSRHDQLAGQSVFQRLKFPDYYCANFRDEIDEFLGIDHSILDQQGSHGSLRRAPQTARSNFVRQNHGTTGFQGHISANFAGKSVGRDFLGRNSRLDESAPRIAGLVNNQRHFHFHGKCFLCLGWGHQRRFCRNSIRCHVCYNYGHISCSCVAQKKVKFYRKKILSARPSLGQQNLELPFIPKPSTSQTPFYSPPVALSSPPSP